MRIWDPKSFWPWIRDLGSKMDKFGSGYTSQIRKTAFWQTNRSDQIRKLANLNKLKLELVDPSGYTTGWAGDWTGRVPSRVQPSPRDGQRSRWVASVSCQFCAPGWIHVIRIWIQVGFLPNPDVDQDPGSKNYKNLFGQKIMIKMCFIILPGGLKKWATQTLEFLTESTYVRLLKT